MAHLRAAAVTRQATLQRRPSLASVLTAVVIAGIAGAATIASSDFIGTHFAGRPMPRDVLLSVIPYWRGAQFVADATVFLSMALLLTHLFRSRFREVPAVVSQFSLAYLLRAGINILTPLASPHGQALYGLMPSQNGMFPSGHSANVLLCFLIADKDRAPRLRFALLVLAVTEWVALLMSRGHYSIDIIGGLLLGYFVFSEWNRGRLFNPLKRLTGAKTS